MRERPSGGVLLPGAALLGGYAATAEISVSERMAIAGRHKVGSSAHATPSRYAFPPLEVVLAPEQGVMT
ncbi:hypothetical protein EDWATA_02387 [Edwardsiella tarda ATCC 23685]|uniref:Uncharacterized protein n=1 Tax=Edwardsiella tarda ATCC 23685 TaxID=500638 RepID=D4F6K6_EDWTA|nr:propionyl-CoA carboxylase, beta subunit [Edwardsiella tarda]EFE22598.1 hypothetical protein EDWATA_02387 [Edwardsiella tarda ATCC 23685]GAC63666.1 hypothetical protein ET1_06_01020 [Edwardsiella tarda ATCC 15947 = NBRC 105688]STD44099.1 Uncharacterised protein [Edwardsiella tarda]